MKIPCKQCIVYAICQNKSLWNLVHSCDVFKQFLKEEIVVRYYFMKGKIQANLENDMDLKKAIEVLDQPDLYFTTLGVESAYADGRN